MIFTPATPTHYVIANDVKIFVPMGMKYVTINMNGVVLGWSELPFIDEGNWHCLVCPGYRLGEVEWENSDTGHYKIYEVQS